MKEWMYVTSNKKNRKPEGYKKSHREKGKSNAEGTRSKNKKQ